VDFLPAHSALEGPPAPPSKARDALAAGRGIHSPCRCHRRVHGRVGRGSAHPLSATGSRKKCARAAQELSGKPAAIQELARFLVTEANHCGAAKMLRRLSDLTTTDGNFADIKSTVAKEFWGGDPPRISIPPTTALRRFTTGGSIRAQATEKAITPSQGEGPGVDSVIVLPCDAKNFPDKPRLGVCLRRAQPRKESSDVVVSRTSQLPS